MGEPAPDISFHRSQWPAGRQDALRACIRRRCVDARFHYESPAQIAAWLAVHNAFSPAHNDPVVTRLYPDAVGSCARTGHRPTCLASIGCGYGQKDLASLRAVGADAYAAIDAGYGMVAAAMALAKAALPSLVTRGLVADLHDASAIAAWLRGAFPRHESVLWLAFGIVPNIPANRIPPILRALADRQPARILLGANLIPGRDPKSEMAAILPQYDNEPTRQWLSLLPRSLGIPIHADDIRFAIVPPDNGLPWRIMASATLPRACRVEFQDGPVTMTAGETVALFFSNRFTVRDIASIARETSMRLEHSLIAPDGNEGVFEIRP